MHTVTDKKSLLKELKQAQSGRSTEQLLSHFIDTLQGKIALASSMAAEDQVLTDMISKITPTVTIFTIDTGRLPQETHDVIEATEERYGISIQVLFPDYRQVEEMIAKHGPNLFYKNIHNRKLCCHIRKVEPLKRGLQNMDAWICGLRKEQSITRNTLETVQWDEQFDLIKLSPLLNWTTEEIWDYIHKNHVPYNALHDQGYPSIGCTPCTCSITKGEDIRAGRWWWEKPEHKECGLHWNKTSDQRNEKQ